MRVDRYCGASFVSMSDLSEGPAQAEILSVAAGKYDKLNVTITDGGQLDGATLSLNKGNVARLARVFGMESSNWVGRQIELSIGKAKDNKGEIIDSIVAKALGPRVTATSSSNGGEKPDDLDDDIPFN